MRNIIQCFHRKCTTTRIAWAIYEMKQGVYITIFVSEKFFWSLQFTISTIFANGSFHNMSSESLSNRENLSDNYSSWNDYYDRTRTGASGLSGHERSRQPSTNTSFTSGGGRTRIPSGGRSAGAYSTPYSSSSSYMPNYSTRRRI